eukprot:COSAG02_NODE_679_length_18565_cov_57.795245_15_plen_158_part_00
MGPKQGEHFRQSIVRPHYHVDPWIFAVRKSHWDSLGTARPTRQPLLSEALSTEIMVLFSLGLMGHVRLTTISEITNFHIKLIVPLSRSGTMIVLVRRNHNVGGEMITSYYKISLLCVGIWVWFCHDSLSSSAGTCCFTIGVQSELENSTILKCEDPF